MYAVLVRTGVTGWGTSHTSSSTPNGPVAAQAMHVAERDGSVPATLGLGKGLCDPGGGRLHLCTFSWAGYLMKNIVY